MEHNQDQNEQKKNKGTGPEDRLYGKGDENAGGEKQQASGAQDKGGVSGRRDQERIADEDRHNEGHDDLDRFDMNSLKGQIENPPKSNPDSE